MPEPRVILGDLAYVESARWHDGRLWFAHWGTDEIVAVDLEGHAEVVGHGPGRTLFMLAAEWRGFEQAEEAIADRTGQVLVTDAPAPHAGWP
jgi:hypothetical protein